MIKWYGCGMEKFYLGVSKRHWKKDRWAYFLDQDGVVLSNRVGVWTALWLRITQKKQKRFRFTCSSCKRKFNGVGKKRITICNSCGHLE